MRRIGRTDETGERVLVDRVKRTRPWHWMSGAGGCYFSVWYGSKMLELKPGITAIQVNKREELPDGEFNVEASRARSPHARPIHGLTELLPTWPCP